jgi:hypothetical protein
MALPSKGCPPSRTNKLDLIGEKRRAGIDEQLENTVRGLGTEIAWGVR